MGAFARQTDFCLLQFFGVAQTNTDEFLSELVDISATILQIPPFPAGFQPLC